MNKWSRLWCLMLVQYGKCSDEEEEEEACW